MKIEDLKKAAQSEGVILIAHHKKLKPFEIEPTLGDPRRRVHRDLFLGTHYVPGESLPVRRISMTEPLRYLSTDPVGRISFLKIDKDFGRIDPTSLRVAQTYLRAINKLVLR